MTRPGQPAFTFDSRRVNLERLRNESFDVFILGGGINGAGIARDLALRARRAGVPLRIALVDQGHFASGTSGKNSQLIHGGLRYLKQLEFRLVGQALNERATLLRVAPHLVEPLPFLIPFCGPLARLYYGMGLFLYDWLAGNRNIGRRRHLSREEVANLEPGLSPGGLHSAAIYYDCKVHSARLVLENVFDAARDGAVVANHVRVENRSKHNGEFRLGLRDMLTGETFTATARKLVDTTGPWQSGGKLRLVRGSHIVLPRLNASENAIAYFGTDGRIIFIIPWGMRDDLSLVGTTDVDHDRGPDDVRVTPEEVRYLLEAARHVYPSATGLRPLAAYSSLRPLIQDESHSATKTSREHRIWWDSDRGALCVAGGKYTTYRAMSEEAAGAVCAEIAPALAGACATAEVAVGENTEDWLRQALSRCGEAASAAGISTNEMRWLIRCYGRLYPVLAAFLEGSPPAGLSGLQNAVLSFAVEHEMAQRLSDVLYVSTYWGYERSWTKEDLLPFALEMGRRFDWTENRISEEIRRTLDVSAPPPTY